MLEINREQNVLSGTAVPGSVPADPDLPDRPIFEELRYQAAARSGKTALNFYGREISYQELDSLSDRFAAGLARLGIEKGDRVGIYLENCPQFVVAFYGILKSGAVAVTCSPMYRSDELEYEIEDAGIIALVIEDSFYKVLAGISPGIKPRHTIVTSFSDFLPGKPDIPLHPTMSTGKQYIEGTLDFMDFLASAKGDRIPEVRIDLEEDLALLQYTAGTTGHPKGAMLTHGNLAVHGSIVRHYYDYRDTDVHLLVLPVFHVTGLDIALNPALAQGATVIMMARFDPGTMLEIIHRFQVTHMVTITPVNIALIHFPDVSKEKLSSLRFVVSGGAPVPGEVRQKWELVSGTPLYEGYGLSECTGGIIGNSPRDICPGTVGRPVSFHGIRLVDARTGKDADPGQPGELWIKGPCVMKGYWNAPEQTRDTLTPDGWLKTGDIAVQDENGRVKIAGRLKEMIKVSGYSVFLEEIDSVLIRHEAVAEAATIGVAHPYRGEEPRSFVVLSAACRDGITPEDMIAYCREKMAAYKVPGQVEFVDDLPKSGAGKILRRVLKEKNK